LIIAQQELALVIRALEFIGLLNRAIKRFPEYDTAATTAFHQAMAIQHRVDRAFGRELHSGISAPGAL